MLNPAGRTTLDVVAQPRSGLANLTSPFSFQNGTKFRVTFCVTGTTKNDCRVSSRSDKATFKRENTSAQAAVGLSFSFVSSADD